VELGSYGVAVVPIFIVLGSLSLPKWPSLQTACPNAAECYRRCVREWRTKIDRPMEEALRNFLGHRCARPFRHSPTHGARRHRQC